MFGWDRQAVPVDHSDWLAQSRPDAIAHLLVPADWPPTPAVQQATQAWIAAHGLPAWQAAVSAGQYHHPEGLFFGGHNPTWSNVTLRHVLQDHAQRFGTTGRSADGDQAVSGAELRRPWRGRRAGRRRG